MPDANPWPLLPTVDAWGPTYATVHRWLQVVGKLRLAQTPWTNHAWHVPFYVTARGLTTSLIPHGTRGFEVAFDVHDHALHVTTTDGGARSFALEPMSVAAFYERTMAALDALGLDVAIWPHPVEIPDPVTRFPDDEAHAAYDADAVHRVWQALVQSHRVFSAFRAGFIGKASPVHVFWGAFDLAATRFSGRTAPKHPGGAPHVADWVMQESYSHEVSSAGFWPGAGLGEAAFYAYAYPEPSGFRDADVAPAAARYHAELGEFVLPYEAVRTADDPDAALTAFLETTYAAAADLGGWDRAALERTLPPVGG